MPKGESIAGFFFKFANVLQNAPTDAHVRIWQELQPWLTQLVKNAAPKWLPRLGLGIPCEVPNAKAPTRCEHAAVAACEVCQKPCCLGHARIDYHGDAICYLCIIEMMRIKGRIPSPQQDPPPPPQSKTPPVERQIWARRVLGLKKNATWEQIERAHRKKVFEWHPDRNPNDPTATDKFREVQEAFDVLKTMHERAAA